MVATSPYFTIVTVSCNDVWSLSKTLRSVAMQSFREFEYVVVDGNSSDNTGSLIAFWKEQGLVDKFLCEPDDGVYDAMNKGVRHASGRYICFMNAGDVFSSTEELQFAYDVLTQDEKRDGLLAWGRLKDQVWNSWWLETDALRMSSLGFCHQSLYLGRKWLERFPFDSSVGRTDCDTKQLADCIADGAVIFSSQRVMAIRSPSDGLSANLELTKKSIVQTIMSGYKAFSEGDAVKIVDFRRSCSGVAEIISLLQNLDPKPRHDLAIMILDTLYLKQARSLGRDDLELLLRKSLLALGQPPQEILKTIWKLKDAQRVKLEFLEDRNWRNRRLQRLNSEIDVEIQARFKKVAVTVAECGSYIVALTTFPARLASLHLVLRSLFAQTLPPEKIVLTVGRDEIRNESVLPEEVRALQQRGLCFNFVDKTCHQYDKFLHNSELNQNSHFVIVDDDVIYPPRAMERLFRMAEIFPRCVIANRSHLMSLQADGVIRPYVKWDREVSLDRPSHSLFPTGAGGVLYPRGFLANCVDESLILELCPYADDVWLKAMSLLNKYKVKSTDAIVKRDWKLGYSPQMSEFALHEGNIGLGLNDLQIRKAFTWLEHQGVNWKSMLVPSVNA